MCRCSLLGASCGTLTRCGYLTSVLVHGADRVRGRVAARVAERPYDVRALSRHDVD